MNADSAHPPAEAGDLLLVVAPAEDSAKRVEAHLRRCGHRVRADWVRERAALEQRLQGTTPDLVLASDHAESVPVIAVVETCRRFAPDLPVLVLTHRIAEGTPESALTTGARDRVGDGDAESLKHLERVFARERLAHQNARQLARARALVAEQAEAFTRLFDDASDALAQVREGILTRLNPAFAARLGYDNAGALPGTPVMDLVAPEHQGRVRDRLKSLARQAGSEAVLNCTLVGMGGRRIPVDVQLRHRATQEGPLLEWRVRPSFEPVPTPTLAETVPQPAVPEPPERFSAAMLRAALRDGRMRLVYRPITPLEQEGAPHLDLGLRLRGDGGEIIPGREFMPAAQRAGLMRAIDRWMIGRAVRAIAARKRSRRPGMLFVSLSGDTLRDADAFLSWLQSLTQGQLFGRDALCLQLAEARLRDMPGEAQKIAGVFREMGARLALSAFGLAQDSAHQLDRLPVDFVKFDATFSRRPDDRELQASLSRLVALARQRKLATILHPLDDAAALARAWQLGVDYMRGHEVRELEDAAPA